MVDHLLKDEFPALEQKVNEHPLVYLDSAATSLKPKSVIEKISKFYSFEAANVHRGAHFLSNQATTKFEAVRNKVKNYINAKHDSEIIFTSGTTSGINLIAQTYAKKNLQAGDEILLSEMEHHSNIVPWQMLSESHGLTVKWVSVTADGELDLSDFSNKLTNKTKIISITHASNSLGTINPINEVIKKAHGVGAKVVVDAAQSVAFLNLDVQEIDCDFLVFSGHKIYGPNGIGVLYGKKDLLSAMPPFMGGGAMIDKVTKSKTTYLDSPNKFEPGTPNVAGVIGLGSAIDFLQTIGCKKIENSEKQILDYAVESLKKIKSVRFIGESPTRVNLLSFVMDGIHSGDVGHLLDQQGVAVRTGHHCNQPLMDKFNITGTIRVSLGVYNTQEDIDVLFKSLVKAEGILR